MTRLLFIVNDASFFVSHRLAIGTAARRLGMEVHVATPPGRGVDAIVAAGLIHHPVAISRRGLNPVAEVRTIIALVALMRRLRPDITHLVTMKPVLYGGIAARLCRMPAVVAAVAGLGFLSDPSARESKLLRLATLPLLRFALAHPNLRVIVQNAEDRRFLKHEAAVGEARCTLIGGSGIELDRYQATPEPTPPIVVTLASRLLKPKGIAEFVAAARLLRDRGGKIRFWLAGDVDAGNPQTVTGQELESWEAGGDVEILGQQNDIPALFAASHIVCLPSYYGEGLPRVLLEAAACGRPVVTTDHPGCRDPVIDGETGVLVPSRDAGALADAIEALALDADRRKAMGTAARRLAEREFGIETVVQSHLGIYRQLMPQSLA